MMDNEKKSFGSYTINDKRGTNNAGSNEVCRVCGDKTVHTKTYNTPTMDCINSLRGRIVMLTNELDKVQAESRTMSFSEQ
jgi:hypothetical protein